MFGNKKRYVQITMSEDQVIYFIKSMLVPKGDYHINTMRYRISFKFKNVKPRAVRLAIFKWLLKRYSHARKENK